MLARTLTLAPVILLLPLTARALNFTKITWTNTPTSALPSTDATAAINYHNGPTSQPFFEPQSISQGLGNNTSPAGNAPTSMTRIVQVTPDADASSYTVQYHETDLASFPTHAFFDVFIDISKSTSDGDPSTIPSSFRTRPILNLGSSGQDGFTIASDVTTPDPAPNDFFPFLLTFTIPEGQTLFFEDVSPVFQPDPDDPGLTSSFFDVYLEIQVTPGSAFNPNLPMFQITTSLNPEPATLSLLTCAAPLLLRKRRRS